MAYRENVSHHQQVQQQDQRHREEGDQSVGEGERERERLEFEDLLPAMVEKLGTEGLMRELAKGFYLLADPSTATITLPSLRRAAPLVGLGGMRDADLVDMLRLGGAHLADSCHPHLTLHQFCVAVLRIGPSLQRSLDLLLLAADEDDHHYHHHPCARVPSRPQQ